MMELIATIILILSLIGIGIILLRKIPVLVELPEKTEETSRENLWLKLKEKIKNIPTFKSFSFEIFLQKILSKVRVLTLKIENKMAFWLQKLRERSQKKKTEENDNYWQELKKSTNQEVKKKKKKILPE